MKIARTLMSLAICGFAATAWSADPVVPTAGPGAHPGMHSTYRVSKMIGQNVKNEQGDKVGDIEDFVIDMKTGKIAYAALSVGGFLGIGDKLFAVPFDQLRMHEGDSDTYFVFNVSKERLEKAPGFDKSKWPAFGDAHWMSVDTYYNRGAQVIPPTTR